MKLFLILLVVCKFSMPIESFNLQDIGKSATDVAKGVIEKIPDAIPSPEDLFQAGKNLIAGYPFEQVCNLSFFFCFFCAIKKNFFHLFYVQCATGFFRY